MFSGIRIPYAEVYALDKILNDCNRLLADGGRPVIDSGAVVEPASEGLFASSLPSDGMAIGVVPHPIDGRRRTTGWVVSLRADPPDSRPAGDGQGSRATAGLEVDRAPWAGVGVRTWSMTSSALKKSVMAGPLRTHSRILSFGHPPSKGVGVRRTFYDRSGTGSVSGNDRPHVGGVAVRRSVGVFFSPRIRTDWVRIRAIFRAFSAGSGGEVRIRTLDVRVQTRPEG